jgi:hypothetical protein
MTLKFYVGLKSSRNSNFRTSVTVENRTCVRTTFLTGNDLRNEICGSDMSPYTAYTEYNFVLCLSSTLRGNTESSSLRTPILWTV